MLRAEVQSGLDFLSSKQDITGLKPSWSFQPPYGHIISELGVAAAYRPVWRPLSFYCIGVSPSSYALHHMRHSIQTSGSIQKPSESSMV